MKILHINFSDQEDDSAFLALRLMEAGGEEAHLWVKEKHSKHSKVMEIRRRWLALLLIYCDRLLNKLFRVTLFSNLSVLYPLNGTYRFFKKLKIYQEADIVHLHSVYHNFFDLDSLLKICREKKVVWTMHAMWCMTGGETFVFLDHGYQKGDANTPFASEYPLRNPLIDYRQRFLIKKRDIYAKATPNLTIVPTSKWLEKSFLKSFVYHPDIHTSVIYNAVNTKQFKNLNQRYWSQVRILFIHQKDEFSGYHLFEKIVDDITHPFDLFLVGKSLKCKHPFTTLPAYQGDSERLNDILNSVDILVYPVEAANFPLLPLQAMATGVYVLAANVGGIPEQFRTNARGLFQYSNANDLLDKLQDTLAMGLNKIREKGVQNEEYVQNNFNEFKMVRQYKDLYKEILYKS
ncbi:glycosyltransferase [Rapidithrix thailandica]|uniref:Glycosyltransferase n=1 Tax=Rapidithrix thailandica TaxID=413964 RepID=A0AAW9SAG8_9BACT